MILKASWIKYAARRTVVKFNSQVLMLIGGQIRW
jgi:hypothetical protein